MRSYPVENKVGFIDKRIIQHDTILISWISGEQCPYSV